MNSKSSSPAAGSAGAVSAPSKAKKIAAITVGNGLEFFDFSIYTYFAAIIGRQFFPSTSEWASLMMSLATFGVGFLVRPLGGIVMGQLADRRGRKPAMTLSLWLMALGSAIFIVTPTYAQIGLAAPLLMIVGRMIQGFAVGGEVGASTSMLLEYADDKTRGFYSSWQLFSQSLSTLAGAGVGLLLTYSLSTEQLESWGWRLPFVLGLLLVPIGNYIRRFLDETGEVVQAPASGKRKHAPGALSEILRLYRKPLLLGTAIVIGGTSANYIVMHYITTYAKAILHMPFSLALWASWIAGLMQLLLCAPAGILADRLGRKPVATWSRLLLIVLVFPAFMLMDSLRSGTGLFVAVVMMVIPLVFTSVSSIVMMSELFPRRVRATGLALCYGLGVSIFGGFSQFIATWLVKATGSNLGPAWYVIGTGLISLVAIAMTPETAGRKLD
ncbi:MFS transporter [Herbaspirillum sp. alder98]|uniref:MFS transporter n=1 Tax=Herbaspirillum sp. alder98 TaxID=2913096 RepID=UPI001CD8C275|nr:MFS transporter [Herbaspirillum sp. alder98]MCA1323149.1 MFS transporter [Herbaspirillum sp. alder98]